MIARVFVGLLIGALGFISPVAAQENEIEPELVWTCPVHRDVTENEAGNCEFCERELIQTLVQQAWSCPIHSVISERAPGKCPICARDLYLITEEVTFACPMHPEVSEVAPGSCPICNMALEPSTSTRPHQDHNPKHGGMFFMAPDNWHHLEGTYPEAGVFRVYLYNNFSEPLNVKTFKGRAVLKEVFDTDTKQTREVLAYPLLAAADGTYLEAHIGSADLPREVTAKVRFEREGDFDRFDFIFADISVDAEIIAPTATAAGQLVIPRSPAGIAVAIAERNVKVCELVTSGNFTQIYLAALDAKDLAVALERHVGEAPAERRASLQWALRQLVRSAWLLDDYGDLGNKEKVHIAYDLFDEAVKAIRSVYE